MVTDYTTLCFNDKDLDSDGNLSVKEKTKSIVTNDPFMKANLVVNRIQLSHIPVIDNSIIDKLIKSFPLLECLVLEDTRIIKANTFLTNNTRLNTLAIPSTITKIEEDWIRSTSGIDKIYIGSGNQALVFSFIYYSAMFNMIRYICDSTIHVDDLNNFCYSRMIIPHSNIIILIMESAIVAYFDKIVNIIRSNYGNGTDTDIIARLLYIKQQYKNNINIITEQKLDLEEDV